MMADGGKSELVERNNQTDSAKAIGRDAIRLPPEVRKSKSRRGNYLFEVITTNGWASPHPFGTLYAIEGGVTRRLWSSRLHMGYGPRFVLVSDTGTVALFDEWINVKTDRAIVLIRDDGHIIKSYSTDDVRIATGVDYTTLTSQAQYGWWIRVQPQVTDDGEAAQVGVAGQCLRVDFQSGRLNLLP